MKIEKVADLSGWNTVESYKKAKKAGLNYTILKAIRKDLTPDKQFESHYKGCTYAGIKVIGTYHYSYATTIQKAKEAAKAWIKVVAGRCNVFYLDWEDTSLPKDNKAIDIINAYADEIHKAGHEIVIYAGLSWYNSYLKPYANKLPYDFWIARYYAGNKLFGLNDAVNDKYMPGILHNLVGWQYTSKANVPGVKDVVDMNLWYADIIDTKETTQITVEYNPFKEPDYNISLESMGEGASWVQWYLWKFGLIQKEDINGYINEKSELAIKEAQARLNLKKDGVVGPITKSVWKKIC